MGRPAFIHLKTPIRISLIWSTPPHPPTFPRPQSKEQGLWFVKSDIGPKPRGGLFHFLAVDSGEDERPAPEEGAPAVPILLLPAPRSDGEHTPVNCTPQPRIDEF